MGHRHRTVSGLIVASVALASACADVPPTQPLSAELDGALFSSRAAPGPSSVRTLDSEFVELARELPGFGGMFYDAAGALNLYLVPRVQALAAAEVGQVVGRRLEAWGHPAAAAQGLVVREGRYDFLQLDTWHHRVMPLLRFAGVVFTDADEARNRVHIGIESHVSQAAVEQALRALGVPREAVIISVTERFAPDAGHTLRSQVRPMAGGLQIGWEHPASGLLACTQGFNARAPGTRVQGFVTTSHCTAVPGQVTGTQYWQHSRSVADALIGTEEHDAPYFSGGICPAGRRCRWSDVAGIRYAPGVNIAFGQIYRTLFPGTMRPGSLEIDPASPRFRIVGELPRPLVGQTLHKVGRTSGWTMGPVIQTCVNTAFFDTDITLLCQELVLTARGPGDSGAPYFQRIGSTNRVRLAGIHWGGSGTIAAMSSLANIRFENPGPRPWTTH